MSSFNDLINAEINNLLNDNLIDITKESYIQIKINNIDTLDDYKESRQHIENLVGASDISINNFDINNITYKLKIFGDYKTIEKQLSDSSFFDILNSSFNDSYLHLAYKK